MSLLLEGKPLHGDNDAHESCSSSDAEHDTWQRAATLAKEVHIFNMSDELNSSMSQQIARDTME